MGLYVLEENKSAQLRPVYKKTDRDYYIYYSSKLYFILVITVSQLYLSLQLLETGVLVLTTGVPEDGSRVRRKDYRLYQHLSGSIMTVTSGLVVTTLSSLSIIKLVHTM